MATAIRLADLHTRLLIPHIEDAMHSLRPTRRASWGAGGAIFAQVFISSKSVCCEYLHDENDRAKIVPNFFY
jgi:hypothetical protein